MDKRKMKKRLKIELIRELWQNSSNQFGESRQEIMLSKMGIYKPSEAMERRFNDLITEMFLILQNQQ